MENGHWYSCLEHDGVPHSCQIRNCATRPANALIWGLGVLYLGYIKARNVRTDTVIALIVSLSWQSLHKYLVTSMRQAL